MAYSMFERIAASKAVDKIAAKVAGRGTHWEPVRRGLTQWQDTPLPVLTLPGVASGRGRMLKPGEKFGRLTVVGYGGKRTEAATYVVRCLCGLYGYRSASSMRSPKGRLMCNPCDYLEELKTGKVPAPHKREEIRVQRKAKRGS